LTAEETYAKLLADLRRDRADIEQDLRRLAEAYGEKMTEYRKVSHGIIGIEAELDAISNEIAKLKERNR
jgi:hypothetical protein